jgi:hypoxanthine phosphoribosyltransferase
MPNSIRTLEDINQMDWTEFGLLVDSIAKNIKEYTGAINMHLDAISPILRNGAIPGTIIANKLEMTTLLPIQLKYEYASKKPIQLLPFYTPLENTLGTSPRILVVECNTYSGASAMLAADILKKAYPDAELYYASVAKVFRIPDIEMGIYRKCFYGVITNENFEADHETAQKLQLRHGITIFPWETAEHELRDINAYGST